MKSKRLFFIFLLLGFFACAGLTVWSVFPEPPSRAVETPIRLLEKKSFRYAALDFEGGYDLVEAAVADFLTVAREQGIAIGEGVFVMHGQADTGAAGAGNAGWEVGTKIDAGLTVSPPLVAKNWTLGRVMEKTYEGPAGELPRIYGEMYEWAVKNGYERLDPVIESYPSAPTEAEDGTLILRLKIEIPVRKK